MYSRINIRGFIALCLLSGGICQYMNAQAVSETRTLKWTPGREIAGAPVFNDYSVQIIKNTGLLVPVVKGRIRAGSQTDKLTVSNERYEPLSGYESFRQQFSELNTQTSQHFSYTLTYAGNIPYLSYTLVPFKIENGTVMKLVSYTINSTYTQASTTAGRGVSKRAATPSVLGTGNWYTVSVSSDGVYKLDKSFLTQLGIDLAGVDPRTIKIFGHHGGMLPEPIQTARPADIPENAIAVSGEQDGVFDDNDYVLFYAEGPHKWKFNSSAKQFFHETNAYSESTTYFITYGGIPGKRVGTVGDGMSLSADITVTDYDAKIFHELDLDNVCRMGRNWLGEKFDQAPVSPFIETFDNIDVSKPATFRIKAASMSAADGTMSVLCNGNPVVNLPIYAVLDHEYGCIRPSTATVTFTPTSGTLNLSMSYNKPLSSSKAYLDYYELFATCYLQFSGKQMPFSKIATYSASVSEYRISNAAGMQVWDISDPLNVSVQQTADQSGTAVFKRSSPNALKQFIAFGSSFKIPIPGGRLENQDLHSISGTDYIIISPPEFMDQASRLADYHRNSSGLTVQVVPLQLIYNEFSSGSQDVAAIRDFVRTVYRNDAVPRLKYILCFGDASYDYKGKTPGVNNTNFVPVYETSEDVVSTIYAYCTDDFFGCIDDGDGNIATNGPEMMEVSVGRLPVANTEEAAQVVDKIVNYHSSPALGDWRNIITFVADDLDVSSKWETTFVAQVEGFSQAIENRYPNFNSDKILLDAYKQVSTGGAERYPDANEAIKRRVDNGSLVLNYIGHGGEEYLASEKVLDIPMINSFNNKDKLPLFFTATCEFSRYDDAKRKSAGEMLFTKAGGGAVAMLTTVRVVNSADNESLTRHFWDSCIFVKINNKWPRLGDVYRKIKNRPGAATNDLSFAFFGDPALVLAYPEYIVKVDSVNGHSQISSTDTLKALAKVRISGHVEGISGNLLSDFNGELTPTVYDKEASLSTLGNSPVSYALPFTLQQNILYRGKVSVSGGFFTFEFVVPKDISYNFGKGKISLYADDRSSRDAAGNNMKVVVGGTASNLAHDTKGPELEVFIDDYNFVSGGLTDQTPLFLAKIYDENGINTAGSGIGRELMAVLDKGTINEKSFVLNNYYTAKLNSYQEGEIKYQMEGLQEGKHTISLKVWDAYNNSSEASTEFVVTGGDGLTISHLLNYPNPFSTNTSFHFDHNKAGQNLNVTIQVLSLTGRVVKTIQQDVFASESHVQEIQWDARDDFGDKLSKGVYVYRVRVKAGDGSSVEKLEKLVILN